MAVVAAAARSQPNDGGRGACVDAGDLALDDVAIGDSMAVNGVLPDRASQSARVFEFGR